MDALKKLRAKFAYAIEHNISPTFSAEEMKPIVAELGEVELLEQIHLKHREEMKPKTEAPKPVLAEAKPVAKAKA